MTWGSWHPHKVKLAVSGCPRNCAEATIKDFGVVAVDSGWELSVGGNGGIHLRGTDALAKVETPDEVLEYCGAFLQLYREDARYLERTAPWVERRGIDWVRERVVADPANRRALNERFLYSQRFAQQRPLGRDAPRDAASPGRVPQPRSGGVTGMDGFDASARLDRRRRARRHPAPRRPRGRDRAGRRRGVPHRRRARCSRSTTAARTRAAS